MLVIGKVIPKRYLLLSILVASSPATAFSMDMEYVNASWTAPYISLGGTVEYSDPEKLKEMLRKHPDVQEVVIENSPGGSLYGGILVAEVIYNNSLSVDLQGSMASAATIISLGARHKLRYFEGGLGSSLETELLFHCAYKSGNDFCDENATDAASQTLEKLTKRPSSEWYEVLMDTTPATVVNISLEEILSYDDWLCEWEVGGYQNCTR